MRRRERVPPPPRRRIVLEHPQASDAEVVAGWATSAAESRRWGGHAVPWPVDPAILLVWHAEPGVQPYVLREDGVVLAYGEVWVDDEEQEVELGRIIVRPDRRGQGVGRLVVSLLVQEAARTGYRSAFMRVVADNAAALACYRAAGFAPVSAGEQRQFNRGQPVEYVWLRRDLGVSAPA
jgi:ribosomal protein S18 acetylase RimI-like enzyme